ncbi:MAG: sulfur carrier protein ThiS [Gemmatimonadaceae bacterium]
MTEVADTEAVDAAERGAVRVNVTVNGERRALPAGTTLADLLRAHELDPRLVVVERNRAILRDRGSFAALVLADGDELELVHFVGGG